MRNVAPVIAPEEVEEAGNNNAQAIFAATLSEGTGPINILVEPASNKKQESESQYRLCLFLSFYCPHQKPSEFGVVPASSDI